MNFIVGDYITGLDYPFCDYAYITSKQESLSHVVYHLRCYRQKDNYTTSAKIGWHKKEKGWYNASSGFLGGAYWKPSKIKPKLTSPEGKKFAGYEENLFVDEEPSYEH